MNKKTQQKLLNIVKNGYEQNADEFSDSRNYIWPELCAVIARSIDERSDVKATKQSRDASNVATLTGLSRSVANAPSLAMTVLDLGCGNGRLFELFRDTYTKYIGIDQSHNLIKLAQKKYPKAKFIQGDVLNINKITDNKYDLILLIAVLPHIPSHELRLELLKNIKNILSAGRNSYGCSDQQNNSKLIITCWNLRARLKYKKLIWKYNILKIFGLNQMDWGDILFSGFNKKSARYYHAFTKKELQKLLEQAGFNIEKIYNDQKNIYAICILK